MSRPPALEPWERAYIRRAFRLRAALSNKALARKFHLSPKAVGMYGNGQHKTREESR